MVVLPQPPLLLPLPLVVVLLPQQPLLPLLLVVGMVTTPVVALPLLRQLLLLALVAVMVAIVARVVMVMVVMATVMGTGRCSRHKLPFLCLLLCLHMRSLQRWGCSVAPVELNYKCTKLKKVTAMHRLEVRDFCIATSLRFCSLGAMLLLYG